MNTRNLARTPSQQLPPPFHNNMHPLGAPSRPSNCLTTPTPLFHHVHVRPLPVPRTPWTLPNSFIGLPWHWARARWRLPVLLGGTIGIVYDTPFPGFNPILFLIRRLYFVLVLVFQLLPLALGLGAFELSPFIIGLRSLGFGHRSLVLRPLPWFLWLEEYVLYLLHCLRSLAWAG
jgi:hypothetical protein